MEPMSATLACSPCTSYGPHDHYTPLTVTTKAGDTLCIFASSEGLRAEIQDTRRPGLATKVLPVHFGPGYSLSSLLQEHRTEFVKDVHLLHVKHGPQSDVKQIVFIGKGGLLGGGGGNSKPTPHSCDNFPPFKCGACAFQCPKGACVECCVHKDHNCEERQKKSQKRRNVAKIQEILIEEEVYGQMTSDNENYDFSYNDLANHSETKEFAQKSFMQVPDTFPSDYKLNENHDFDILSHKAGLYTYPAIFRIPVSLSKNIHTAATQREHQETNFNYTIINILIYLLHLLVYFTFNVAHALAENIPKISSNIVWNVQKGILYFQQQQLPIDQTEKFLLHKLVNYRCTHKMNTEKFRLIWEEVNAKYEYKDRIHLLQSLIQEEILYNTSLLDICNLLTCILKTEKQEFTDVSNRQKLCSHDLKKIWLQSNIENIQNSILNPLSKSDLEKLTELLTNMDWCVEMCEIFFEYIAEQTTEDCSELFTLLQKVSVPEAVVLPVLVTSSHDTSSSRVRTWILFLSYQMLCNETSQMGFDNDSLAPLLFQLLQHSCASEVLLDVISQQKSVIKKHTGKFVEVLKLLSNYQVKSDVCKSALLCLRKAHPEHWLKTVDQNIVSNLFQSSKISTVDELINFISEHSIFTSQTLESYFHSVKEAYSSPSKMSFTKGGSIFESLTSRAIQSWSKENIKLWTRLVKKGKPVSLYEKVAVLIKAAKLHYGFEPRGAQILSLLVLLHPKEGTGRLVQINTGEGKSLIVAMLAAIHAIQGNTVDVITTSIELSRREVVEQKPFFSMLGLTVAENSEKSAWNALNAATNAIYKRDILYGTATDFQADILKKEFQGIDCRAERGYGVVIVDEVDSMLYDNHTCSVRLSGPIPGMNHLEIALAAIWERVNRIARHLVEHNDRPYFIPDEFEMVHGTVKLRSGDNWTDVALPVKDKESFIIEKAQKHMIQALRLLADFEKEEYEEYKELLRCIRDKETEIDNTNDTEKIISLTEEYDKMQEEYKHLPWHSRYPVIEIPAHLHDFAMSQLPYWIKNAVAAAFSYKKDFHYTVRDNRIVPIQYNETGVLMPNLVWSDGLTQFLQIKEDLPVEPESITTNFISNISFFQRYGSAIYGLTGTLGEKSTQEFLSEIYNVDMVAIPPHKVTYIVDNEGCDYLCKELLPIIVPTVEEWYDSIVTHTLFHAQQHRAVLIICKFIKHVKLIEKRLHSDYDPAKVVTYTGEELSFDKKEIDSGQVIIATNIAGRGTDIKTSTRVENNGGMYVMITFLPDSHRVELQNVGRTAREGKKGMAQIIMHNPRVLEMRTLKGLRKEQENRINKRAIQEAKKVLIHDELFKRFCDMQCKLLPSVPDCEKTELWRKLTSDWEESKNKYLCTQMLRAKFDKLIADKIKVDNIDEDTKEKIESQWTTYKTNKVKNVLEIFCVTRPYPVPADLLACLRESRNFEPNASELATKHKWGQNERKALEEQWGLWFKSQRFETQNFSLESAMALFDDFQKSIDEDAKINKLIKNSFYYVLKGNEYLNNAQKKTPSKKNEFRNSELCSAISCYDRAISLDPAFSLNAHYNKACALFSFADNMGWRQKDALQELTSAGGIINDTFLPILLTFHTLVAQTGVHKLTAQHVKHQYDVLSQQLNYIEKASEIIRGEKSDFDVSVTSIPVKKVLEVSGEDHSKAVQEAATNGLTHLFTIKAVAPFPWWTVIGIALIGVAALVTGGLLLSCGIVALGAVSIEGGVCAIMAAIHGAISGDFSAGTWVIHKAIGWAMSLMTAGWEKMKTSAEKVEKAATAVKSAVQDVKDMVGKVLQNESFQQCLSDAEKSRAMKNLMEGKQHEMVSLVKKILGKQLLQNKLLKKALGMDNANENKDWERFFIYEAANILNDDDQRVHEQKLQELLSSLCDTTIRNEETKDNENSFMSEFENYIRIFSKKFEVKVKTHESRIVGATEGKGMLLFRYGRYAWRKIKASWSTNSNMQAENEQDEEITNLDNYTFDTKPSHDIREADIPAMSTNKKDNYTTKVNPKTKDIGDLSYNHQMSVDTLTDLFSQRICQVLFLNMRYRSSDSDNANLAHEMFREVDAANARLREKMKNKQDMNESYTYENFDQPLDKTEQFKTDHQEGIPELNDTLKSAIESLECDLSPDSAILELTATILEAPVLVFEGETGKLVHIAGKDKIAEPILLKITKPTPQHPSGEWEPLEHSASAQAFGPSKYTDALWNHIYSKDSSKFTSQADIVRKMKHWIHDNPVAATEYFERQNSLNKLF